MAKKLREINSSLSKNFLAEFKEIIQTEHENVAECLGEATNSDYNKAVLGAKSNIFCFLLSNTLSYIAYKDREAAGIGSELLSSIREVSKSALELAQEGDKVLEVKLKDTENKLNKARNQLDFYENKFEEMKTNFKAVQQKGAQLGQKIEQSKSEFKQTFSALRRDIGELEENRPAIINEKADKILELNSKTLPLKKLKETVKDILASKKLKDKHNLSNKLPRETLEQHFYTHLSHKYGLNVLF